MIPAILTLSPNHSVQLLLAVVWLAGMGIAGVWYVSRAVARQVRRHRMLARLERMAW